MDIKPLMTVGKTEMYNISENCAEMHEKNKQKENIKIPPT